MRQSKVAIFGGAVILLSALSYPALAEPTPTPTPMSQMEQFRQDRDLYIAEVRERNQKIRNINQIFNLAVKKARLGSKIAMQAAVNPDEKSRINANLKSAISAAIISRENAIEALGEPPTPPIAPSKSQKGFQSAKNSNEKNRRS